MNGLVTGSLYIRQAKMSLLRVTLSISGGSILE